MPENLAFINDVSPISHRKRLSNIVIGNQHADPAAFRSLMIFCRSSTAMGSIPENGSSSRMNLGLMHKRSCDLHPSPLTARKSVSPVLPYMLQPQLIDQLLHLLPALVPGQGCASSTARMFSSTVSLRKTELPEGDN